MGLPVRPALVFHLDLQVLRGTLDKPVLENRNRCHKTPLRTAFACVTTPPVMPGVPTKAVRHATFSLLADGKQTLLFVFPVNNVAFYFHM